MAAQVRAPAQVLIVFAITVVSILTVVGLLYSFGLVLAQRRALQTAADASSLRGTWQVLSELASDNRSDSAVVASIVQLAMTNGVPSDGTAANASYISATYLDSSGSTIAPVGSGGWVSPLKTPSSLFEMRAPGGGKAGFQLAELPTYSVRP